MGRGDVHPREHLLGTLPTRPHERALPGHPRRAPLPHPRGVPPHPTDADVLCETQDNFFAGKLQDISLGGAYVQAAVPFRLDSPLRLTFCTFDDHQPLELDGRVAWANPAGARKSSLPEGAGVQFTHRTDAYRAQLEDYVYELVEDTLSRANLI